MVELEFGKEWEMNISRNAVIDLIQRKPDDYYSVHQFGSWQTFLTNQKYTIIITQNDDGNGIILVNKRVRNRLR